MALRTSRSAPIVRPEVFVEKDDRIIIIGRGDSKITFFGQKRTHMMGVEYHSNYVYKLNIKLYIRYS